MKKLKNVEVEQKRCYNCIHYTKTSKKRGYCMTNLKILVMPLFDENNTERKFFVTVNGTDYCGLHEVKKTQVDNSLNIDDGQSDAL
jgi:hypothetical protein